MKRYILAMAAAALAVVALPAAGPSAETTPGPAAYARLKTLVGEWEATTPMGKMHLSYELIAGGTSLVRTHQRRKKYRL